MKSCKAMQLARDEQDNDTATEQRLVAGLAEYERLVCQSAADGVITPADTWEILQRLAPLRTAAERSLERNRLVASLLCAAAGGLDPYAAPTRARLPALRMLGPADEGEDSAA